jgi:hypothetical protein
MTMGYLCHHAFVVTGSRPGSGDLDVLIAAHSTARELGLEPTELTPLVLNGFRSFMIPPDGSKAGWPEDAEGNRKRAAFREWLAAQNYADGSSPVQWVEVQYGDDEDDNRIVACSV